MRDTGDALHVDVVASFLGQQKMQLSRLAYCQAFGPQDPPFPF